MSDRVYRCTTCGLLARLAAGNPFQDEQIYCPRCDGVAFLQSAWSETSGEDIVEVMAVDDDGHTRELGVFEPDADDHTRTTRPVVAGTPKPRYGRRPADDGFDMSDDTLLVEALDHSPPAPPEGEATPVGPPSLAFSPPTAEAVSVSRSIDAGGPAGARLYPAVPHDDPPESPPSDDKDRTTRPYGALGPEGVAAARAAEPGSQPQPQPEPEPQPPARLPSAESGPPPRLPHRGGGTTESEWQAPRMGPPAPIEATATGMPLARPAPGENIARGGPAWQGKAWSASGIRRALVAEGLDPDEGEVSMPTATPTDGMRALPDVPKIRVDVPPRARRKRPSGSRPAPPPLAPSPNETTAPHDGAPGNDNSDGYLQPTPVSARPVRRRRRTSRTLLLVTICVAVLSTGVLVGIVWYQGERPSTVDDGLTTIAFTDELLAVAQARAESYGLSPLVRPQPFPVSYEVVSLEYPNHLEVRLRITNQSGEEVAALHASAAWHLVHDVLEVVRLRTNQFDRPVSIEQPLLPGEQVTVSMALTATDVPPGAPRESFLWVDVTAANDQFDVFFDAGALMVEVATE